MKRLRDRISNFTYCYDKDGGSGFIEIKDCKCRLEKCCTSYLDNERFIKRFDDFLGSGKSRDEIIKIIKPEFKDSKWWKDNVVE